MKNLIPVWSSRAPGRWRSSLSVFQTLHVLFFPCVGFGFGLIPWSAFLRTGLSSVHPRNFCSSYLYASSEYGFNWPSISIKLAPCALIWFDILPFVSMHGFDSWRCARRGRLKKVRRRRESGLICRTNGGKGCCVGSRARACVAVETMNKEQMDLKCQRCQIISQIKVYICWREAVPHVNLRVECLNDLGSITHYFPENWQETLPRVNLRVGTLDYQLRRKKNTSKDSELLNNICKE
jgi:hypothetical protein